MGQTLLFNSNTKIGTCIGTLKWVDEAQPHHSP